LQSKINVAANDVLRLTKNIYPTHQTFVGDHTCTRLIWTQGTSVRETTEMTEEGLVVHPVTKELLPLFGFCNKPHFDNCDKIKKELYKPWFDRIWQYRHSPGFSKLKEAEQLVGMGMPTTCGYNLVNGCSILPFFTQMFFCLKLHDGGINHFLGWAMAHCTCVPIIFQDGLIKSQNKDGHLHNAFVLAWGGSGGSAHAAQRNSRNNNVECSGNGVGGGGGGLAVTGGGGVFNPSTNATDTQGLATEDPDGSQLSIDSTSTQDCGSVEINGYTNNNNHTFSQESMCTQDCGSEETDVDSHDARYPPAEVLFPFCDDEDNN
jgi:hypothetical protein